MRRLEPLSAEIHPADEMLRFSVASVRGNAGAGRRLYLEKGRQIAETQLALVASAAGSGALLDFASGYGRSTRFLVTAFPATSVTVSDVQLAGLDFQRVTFGVRTAASASDPERFQPGRRFALVFAASFFTHVPPARFAPWLLRLASLVEEDGVLAFSTLPVAGNDAGSGAAVEHRSESESAVLAPEEYGTTWVADGFVAAALAAARTPGDRLDVVRRGLCAHQDLWLLRRGRAAAAPVPDLPRHPAGEVDRFEIDEREAHIAGWAEDLAEGGDGLAEITLRVGDDLAERSVPAPRTRHCRFRFVLDRRHVGLDDAIEIAAQESGGASNLLAVGTLRPFTA